MRDATSDYAGTGEGVSLTIVVPTRNRAELAMAAADGLLAEGDAPVRVIVSDNSSEEAQVDALADFCRRRSDSRLTYLRAPEMMQGEHWNWALEQALAREPTTHFSLHYDRKIPRPGQWRYMLEAIETHPDQVITYATDQVLSQPPRWALWQTPWTGKTYEMPTKRVLQMVSQGRIAEMGQAIPLLSNCAIPRAVLERIRGRFGDICSSTGPDGAFGFRFCAIEDAYVHLDRPLGVTYAIHRSNGAGFLSGAATDFEDWKRRWGDRPWLDAAPLPGLNLGWNILFHEYEVARREVGGNRFPPLTMRAYLDGLAQGLPSIEDADRRAQHAALLASHGWKAPPADERPPQSTPVRTRPLPPHKRAWLLLHRRWAELKRRPPAAFLLARTLRIEPDHITGSTFASERQALRYAMRLPRRRVDHHEFLDWRFDGDACT